MGVCKIEDCALTVLTTVFSNPALDRVVCDAGSKAYCPPGEWMTFTNEGPKINLPLNATGGGIVKGLSGEVYENMTFHRWGEECGMINIYDSLREVKIGDKLEVIPYHACSTVNLHDEIVGVRSGEVEVTWPIAARGKIK